MLNTISGWLFDSSGLTPHGFCLLWRPGLIWAYSVSDTIIALSYFSIPLALAVIARRRRDLVFRPLLLLFAAFILLCGTTHWCDVATIWMPIYGFHAFVKAITAIVSVFTAVWLWVLLPKVVLLPSPSQMREANAALIASREQLIQAQKMEAVGQLTGGIAHDFNNMLQTISSSLALLERRIAQGRAEDAARYIEAIRHASDNAASLTNRLLTFSRRQTLRPRQFAPDQLVANIAELIRRTIGPSIRLDLRLDNQIWDVECDPNQLENTLLNLAINARDAMPEGGVLTIATSVAVLTPEQMRDADEAPGNYVRIEVCDTGAGMTEDVLAHVFEPFFTTKPDGEGTGLGLSQVYGFVRQSGGVVRLDSTPGSGTTVRIYLPARISESAPDAAVPPGTLASPEAAGQAGATILLVEDQKDVRSQLAEVLAECGYTVVEAEDGASGMRALQTQGNFDMLVTDVGLPGLNGRQLADAARALIPGIPVLLITGFAGKALDSLRPETGIDVLRKPFLPDDLISRVRLLLAS